MASKRLKDLVASGKLTLHHCDVAAMPLGDSTVDKVFHCNCYYFWPHLRTGGAEIHRVMRPGSCDSAVGDGVKMKASSFWHGSVLMVSFS